jgi:DNA modification methylase
MSGMGGRVYRYGSKKSISILKNILPLNDDFDSIYEGEIDNKVASNGAHLSNVFTYPIVSSNGHCCEKPEGLMIDILKTFGAEKNTILDPFMGSGTTGVAALKLGRKFIGIEIDPTYFKIACDRIAKEANQMKLFDGIKT